jgi:hypothetical protein
MVRPVGFFAELDPSRPDLFRESIYEARGDGVGESETEIVQYLKDGVPILDIMEGTRDVIADDTVISGGSSILGDGTWVWREDLAHYVGRYHIKLDEDFVRHVKTVDFRVPPLQNDRAIELVGEVGDLLGMS